MKNYLLYFKIKRIKNDDRQGAGGWAVFIKSVGFGFICMCESKSLFKAIRRAISKIPAAFHSAHVHNRIKLAGKI